MSLIEWQYELQVQYGRVGWEYPKGEQADNFATFYEYEDTAKFEASQLENKYGLKTRIKKTGKFIDK